METIWDGIHEWLRQNALEVLGQLRPPAKPAQIERVEKFLRRALPADFRVSLAVHDGTSPELGLLGGRELLALPQAEEVWRRYLRTVRPPNNRWWPIAQDIDQGEAHFLCVDATGRVVTSWHYGSGEVVVADSFSAWLGALFQDMEQGFVLLERCHLELTQDGSFSWPEVRPGAFISGPRSRRGRCG